MHTLKINSVEVRSVSKCCKKGHPNCIMVGKCYDDQIISSYMTFPGIVLKENEFLDKAILKMYCKRACGVNKCININIDKDDIKMPVIDTGFYEWDVTELIKTNISDHFRLCAYTNDEIKRCGLKEFEALNPNMKPQITLFIGSKSEHEKHVTNIVKEYISTNSQQHSEWIECTSLKNYYYFIKNQGNGSVEIFSEISPDRTLFTPDSGTMLVGPHETFYLQPIRASRFVRLAFKNHIFISATPIKVWFQGI